MMIEQDKFYLSKYAVDPEIDINFDGYEIPDFDFSAVKNPQLENLETDQMDEDLWAEY